MTTIVRRRAALLGALVVCVVSVGQGGVLTQAQAAGEPGATASARTVQWSPRHPDDRADAADPAAFNALKDWKLSVSQTTDLLNQTVQVSWEGATSTPSAPLVQLMQCWSAGPDVEPTREQCAYGGVSPEDASSSGSLRTRAIGGDARERDYFFTGELVPVSVDGAVPPVRWAESAPVVLGTTRGTCPEGTTRYTAELTPPREAVLSGKVAASVVLEGPTDSPPASLTREEKGTSVTYPTVTGQLNLSARAAGLASWPLGTYRVALRCQDAAADRAGFVGYLERADVDGNQVWRRGFRGGGVSVPFDPVGEGAEQMVTDPYDPEQVFEYLKPRSTNEVSAAKSRPNGAGSVFMEMLTDLEAPHLGCGRVESKGPRACWLVAVPRFGPGPGDVANPKSPMSQTFWDRRIAVPLAFAPVASGCQVGSGLKQIIANSSSLQALRSWQPTFCRQASTASSVVGPLSDDSIRSGLGQANRMGVASVPDAARPATVVTAPISTSGVVVGFVVDRQIRNGSDLYGDLHETRSDVMNLNARLVAKLLTQSYDDGAYPNGGKPPPNDRVSYSPERKFPAKNPKTLYQDPEFLRLNPDFARWLEQAPELPPRKMADVLVAGQNADAYQVLWQWLLGDAEAKSFLDGAADPNGMLVNPYYKGALDGQTSSFTLFDPTCLDQFPEKAADAFPLLCQPNEHPRVKDDAEAAQAAVRGDTKRVNVPPPGGPLGAPNENYSADARQPQGQAGILVITTSANAERYGLPTARLLNADGTFVPATADSMTRAREQMTVRPDGVLVPEPTRARGGAYPLTVNSYAMVDVAATTQDQNSAFATVLDYAAGDGQAVGRAIGQLPPGYAPLDSGLRAQTRRAVTLLRDPSSLLPRPDAEAPADAPDSNDSPSDVASDTPDPSDTPNTSDGGDSTSAGAADPTATGASDAGLSTVPSGDAGAAAPAVPPGARPVVAGSLVRTSGASAPMRWLVPGLVVVGLLAGLGGRVLPLLRRPAAS